MATIDNISVAEFKTLFSRDFPYLPVYVGSTVYFKDDIVYYGNNFYKSITDNNTALPTDTEYWELVNDSVNNYISDADILRAFEEAKVNFNANLFKDDGTAEMVFYYLAAHYLVIDLNNAMNPLAMGFMGFTQSKSVGSVSESYGIPQWMLNNDVLGLYAQTGYGRKYLSLIRPYMIGNIILTPGKITCG
jgi:hypothetical protein